jgi:tRNA-splicing ligase RtcB (3'-phosphate/5'-hydroxy nucleic acid ligase)
MNMDKAINVPGKNIFGTHDQKTLVQLADVASRAEKVALLSDGHLGYIMPIGGVAAYDNKVSVAGVGFDIACLAKGTHVVTKDGYFLPIEEVRQDHPITCWDGKTIRAIQPNLGAVAKGTKATLKLELQNGREIVCTPDHQMMTLDGWKEASQLTSADKVACQPFKGLPFAEASRDPRFVRILGYVCGDGHLTNDGKRVSIYTTVDKDAETIVEDLRGLGYVPRVYRRNRGSHLKTEIHIAVNSVDLHRRLSKLGSPVAKKVWLQNPMPWLFNEPAWLRAQFLSAFASAEMMTPRVNRGSVSHVPNLQLKQAGENTNAIDFIARLFQSLSFEVSVARSGKPYGERFCSVLQLLGGQEAQLRFLEDVGFCYAYEKRVAAAEIASIIWQTRTHVQARDESKREARELFSQGIYYKDVIEKVSAKYGVSKGFVYHSIYDERGASRRLPSHARQPETSGEIVWVPVLNIEPYGQAEVFDIVTNDPAHAFFANGVTVHNCGNAAILTNKTLADVENSLPQLADEIATNISFGIGRKNVSKDAPDDHKLFESNAWEVIPSKGGVRQRLLDKARNQLGTVGSGNHYVDVFADEGNRLWVGVHFGSRGLGHTIATAFMSLSQGGKWEDKAKETEALLSVDDDLGKDYWSLMNLAGEYAYAGREWVARKVIELLGAEEKELVHNHHNFAWKEKHGGKEYIVVRKGATPAFPGQKGFVGGSMGDNAVILQGATNADEATKELQEAALYSTVHGAGRVMSRTEAAGKWDFKRKVRKTAGKISAEMMNAWLKEKGVMLRGGGMDEAPQAYRRLPDVLAAQGKTIEILHTLKPLIVVMAGENEFDPYKD